MRNNYRMNVFLAIIAIVLLTASAQAALIVNKVTDEFSLESPYPVDSVKSCECGTRTEILEIKNIGDFKTLFKVEIFSPIKDLISLSRDTFDLDPGQATKVFVYVYAPCDTSVNTFYMARVSTNYGRSKELYKNFVSQKCQCIKFTSSLVEDELFPGDIITTKIDIQNVCGFPETFTISPLANSEIVTLSTNNITLNPDEQKSIYMYQKFPLGVYGRISQPFSIHAAKSNNYVEAVQLFDIAKDYDFSIKTEELELSCCGEITTKSVVTIDNLAGIPNKYYLSMRGPSFINLSQDSIELEAKESDFFTMQISPQKTDAGRYDVVLQARSEHGSIIKEKSFKLTVNDCFSSKASLNSEETRFSEKACCGEKTYTLNIRNDGLYEEAYELITDSPGWLSIPEEHSFVRLKPSQQMNIPVKAVLPCTDAKQTSFIMVKQLHAPYKTSEIRVDLESLSLRSCYDVQLLQDSYQINYETASIPVLLKNNGLKGGTYSLALGEMSASFVYLAEQNITLEAGETKVLHVYPRNYSEFKQGTYLDRLTLKISPKDERSDISYERQFWVVLKDKSFLTKAIDYLRNFNYSRIGYCGLLTLVLAGIVLLLVIIVIFIRTKADFKMKRMKAATMKRLKTLNMILIGLLLLCILAIILIGSPDMEKYYDSPSNKTGPLFQEWKSNTPLKIDLAQYYSDPDMDALSFTASQPNHIHVKIDGSIVTLTPEYDWAGTEFIVFTAKDAKGAMTDSPVMTLHVMKRHPVGILGYWSLYCKHINLALIAIILLVCLMITDTVEEKAYNYYNPRKNMPK